VFFLPPLSLLNINQSSNSSLGRGGDRRVFLKSAKDYDTELLFLLKVTRLFECGEEKQSKQVAGVDDEMSIVC